MGVFVAKLKEDEHRWYKLKDNVQNEDYDSISLVDSVAYDPNNTVAGQWFRIEDFEHKDGFLNILKEDFDVVDLESLTNEQFVGKTIDFIAYYQDHKYYIQKFTKGNFMKKKWFSWDGDAVEYNEKDDIVFINPEPNCIYDNVSKRIYFKDIAKAYNVFGGLRIDYKAATDAETTRMLQLDILNTDNFTVQDVGVSNRKRITSILAKYENYEPDKKNTIKQYIREKVGNNLEYDEDAGQFVVKNDKHLKLLLYGIQQRFYQPPLEKEVQIATATTGISNIL